jgi:hypothetical protein
MALQKLNLYKSNYYSEFYNFNIKLYIQLFLILTFYKYNIYFKNYLILTSNI